MAKEPDEKPKTITLDQDALAALIEAKVKAGIAEAAVKATVDATDFEKAMREVRGQDKPVAPIRYEDCESPLTGARFKAKIQASRTSPLGRVIDLEDYQWPVGIDVPQSAGGLMPDEFIPALEAPGPATEAIRLKYEHWKYWDFQRADRAEFASGKLFTNYIRREEADKRRAAQAEAERLATEASAASALEVSHYAPDLKKAG